MKGQRIWIAGLGLASLLCVFLDSFPRSVVPLAVFLYLCLPGPDPVRRAEERRARSRAIRKRRKTRTSPIRILEREEELHPEPDTPSHESARSEKDRLPVH
jgi:hypothetical protein